MAYFHLGGVAMLPRLLAFAPEYVSAADSAEQGGGAGRSLSRG